MAQLLDYGSWVQSLSDQDVRDQYGQYKPGEALEQGWSSTFGGNPPDELNSTHRLTVVASDVDPATERIIGYLAGMDVPINVVFFRYFSDAGRSYLARTWLLDESHTRSSAKTKIKTGSGEIWNEQDWYLSFGEESGRRSWEDARKYGFTSAGGGEWFSKTLKKLLIGARVFACIPKTGYVGVGTVTGPAQPIDSAVLTVDGQEVPMRSLDLKASYTHLPLPDGEDVSEYVVPITWDQTRRPADAVWVKGMFANQNSACKLRNQFTLQQLAAAFHLG